MTTKYYIKDWTHHRLIDCKQDAAFYIHAHPSAHKYEIKCRICARHVGWSRKAEHELNIRLCGLVDDDTLKQIKREHTLRMFKTHDILPYMLPTQKRYIERHGEFPPNFPFD